MIHDNTDWVEPKEDLEVVDNVSHKMNWRSATRTADIIQLFPKTRPKFDEVAELAQKWREMGKPDDLRLFLDRMSRVAESKVSQVVRRMVL